MGTTNLDLQEEEKTVRCNDESFRIYLDSDTIRERVEEIGAQISRDFEGQNPILIGVLNGAFIFLADLMRSIDIECEVDFIKLSSYGDEKVSRGEVEELKRIDADLEGRHVLIVEDIVDTGLSMNYILGRLDALHPASASVVTLLHKHEATQMDVPLDYVGFRIDDLFVIGYGLDYGQVARNLSDIYIQSEQ